MISTINSTISWIDTLSTINLATDNLVKLSQEYYNSDGSYNFRVITSRIAILAADIASYKNANEQDNVRKMYEIIKKYNSENLTLVNRLKNEKKMLQKMNVFFQTVGLMGTIVAKKDLSNEDVIQRFAEVIKKTGDYSDHQNFSKAVTVILAGEMTGLRSCLQAIVKESFNYWSRANSCNAILIDLGNLDYDYIPDKHKNDPVLSQFICPITEKPIRYPVTASNPKKNLQGNSLPDFHVERRAIVSWLNNHDTNPLTDHPLQISDFRENLQMREIIEDQMDRLDIPKTKNEEKKE